MFLLSTQQTAIIMLLVCIIPIAALILLAIIFRVKASIKNKKNKSENVDSKELEEQFEVFAAALGGNDNYVSSSIERNKITFKVVDSTLVNGEKLKELGASGVLIIGDEVRASFGDRASYVYDVIKK